MANYGKFDDKQIISEKTVKLAFSEPKVAFDGMFFGKSKFPLGGFNIFE